MLTVRSWCSVEHTPIHRTHQAKSLWPWCGEAKMPSSTVMSYSRQKKCPKHKNDQPTLSCPIHITVPSLPTMALVLFCFYYRLDKNIKMSNHRNTPVSWQLQFWANSCFFEPSLKSLNTNPSPIRSSSGTLRSLSSPGATCLATRNQKPQIRSHTDRFLEVNAVMYLPTGGSINIHLRGLMPLMGNPQGTVSGHIWKPSCL